MWGRIGDTQRELLTQHVNDRIVADLGAGDLLLSKELIDLGARKVIAVDSCDLPLSTHPRIQVRRRTPFTQCYLPEDTVVFLSWPSNHHCPGLFKLLKQATKVIYLGVNTGGTQCGTPALFKMLLHRELLANSHYAPQTLLIYGKPLDKKRPAVFEEFAGMHLDETYYEEDFHYYVTSTGPVRPLREHS